MSSDTKTYMRFTKEKKTENYLHYRSGEAQDQEVLPHVVQEW